MIEKVTPWEAKNLEIELNNEDVIEVQIKLQLVRLIKNSEIRSICIDNNRYLEGILKTQGDKSSSSIPSIKENV